MQRLALYSVQINVNKLKTQAWFITNWELMNHKSTIHLQTYARKVISRFIHCTPRFVLYDLHFVLCALLRMYRLCRTLVCSLLNFIAHALLHALYYYAFLS